MYKQTADIKDLNLLLLYLSGWEEKDKKNPKKKIFRTWKGYLFDVLNELKEDGMTEQYMNQMSVTITEKGIERAKKIKEIIFNALKEVDNV